MSINDPKTLLLLAILIAKNAEELSLKQDALFLSRMLAALAFEAGATKLPAAEIAEWFKVMARNTTKREDFFEIRDRARSFNKDLSLGKLLERGADWCQHAHTEKFGIAVLAIAETQCTFSVMEMFFDKSSPLSSENFSPLYNSFIDSAEIIEKASNKLFGEILSRYTEYTISKSPADIYTLTPGGLKFRRLAH